MTALTYLDFDLSSYRLPEFDWITIPPGEFWMGSRKEKKPGFFERLFGQTTSGQTASSVTPVDFDAYNTELPQHCLHLPVYRLARTPVTNAQFRPFVAANGYTTQSFWSAAGWEWRTHNKISEPRFWKDNLWNGAKQPMVGVSWYEALAYANWLAQTTGETVRLPTEAEWEKAARGTDGQLYPWGNQPPNKTLCNFNGNVGRTTSVNAYPKGASPYGVLDMAGNVWEWTATKWLENYENYATLMDNNFETDACRAVRGGSWAYNRYYVRAALRGWYTPDYRNIDLGFRLVLAVAPDKMVLHSDG